MMGLVIRWLASAVTLLVLANTVEGFTVEGIGAAMTAVVVLAIGNVMLKPFVKAITTAGCLINFLTLGLFEAVVGFVFWFLAFSLIGDWFVLVEGFQTDGIGPVLIGAVSLAAVNAILTPFLDKDERRDRRDERR